MKMLVTGGAGFIGSHVAEKLLAAGHKAIVFDNLSTGSEKNINSASEFIKGDVSISSDVKNIFSSFDIDMVFHLAAQIDVRISTEEPERDAQTNIVGTINILNEMKKNKTKKIVFSSTGGALYGDVNSPAEENHEKNPKAPYGISKLASEYYIRFFSDSFSVDYTILRYANVYGPRQSIKGEAGVVAIFADNMKHNRQSVLYGFGEMYRDYVFVSDVAEANLISVSLGSKETYNVGTGKRTSVKDIFNLLKRSFPKYSAEPILKESRTGEVMNSVVSPEKISKDYNISFTPIEDGIGKTAEYFKERE
ncbi:MAG: NAD-dependent epimerase/dehydratase family protein [bacterium]|nr:NAD-dependent epimerase/dehydratase family protein [bacterium]